MHGLDPKIFKPEPGSDGNNFFEPKHEHGISSEILESSQAREASVLDLTVLNEVQNYVGGPFRGP